MTSVDELARLVVALERKVNALERTEQLTSSTVGDDGDSGSVAEVVADAAVTTDALPSLQDDAADAGAAASDLASILQANEEDIDARFADAAVDLQLAQEQLDEAQEKLDDAFIQIGDLDSASEATSQIARDAAAAASSAATTATNASQAASSAQSTADAAKTAAATANQAALDASGLAATKGRVIVQISAPTGANADPNNLWIDISGSPSKNTPNRYNTTTSKWEAVSDQKAIDAAAAAAAATTAASTAQSTADAAKTTASAAQTAASNAQSTADQAQQTAGTAASNAQAAIVSASAAQSTADTAKTNAANAKTAADNANTQALAAAGIANGKGKLIVQVSAPTGANAAAENLWLDISTDGNGKPKNQPNRWNPSTSKWEPITDQKVVDAATAAAAAQSTASSAATAASNAQSSADAARGAAATAQSTADTAKANAATAQTAANTAQSTADTAKTNAATAQSAADNANSQALSAAGIANGKGRVIYQASAPTGANASANNLWIRSSDNIPFTYDATNAKWVQATDKTAVDAAAAAATANTAAGSAKAAADSAASAASAAQQTANQASNAAAAAQTTATGKPQILFGTGTPVGTAPQGSTWFQVDSVGSVIGQWQQTDASVTGSTWSARQIRSEVMANLDLGKLTAGTAAIVDAVIQKIAAQTANIQTANISNLFVTSGATLSSAVIEALFAQVVQAHKITADMIDVGSLNGITLTGTLIKTAATGARLEILKTVINVYNADNGIAASIRGDSFGGSQGAIVLQGVWSGKAGTFQVVGAVPETAATGTQPTVGSGIGYANGVASATSTTWAPGYRAQQVMISPEFWVAPIGSTPGQQARRAVGRITTPAKYDIVQGAFQRFAYSYFDIDQQALVDIPVIFGPDNATPTKVIVQADEFRTRDRVLSFADSGWLTPSVQTGAGYSVNTLRYRKVGNQVWWVGQLNRSSAMAAGTVGSVPAAYAPSLPGGDSRMVVAATATAGTLLRIAFYPDGRFDILDISGGSSTYALFHGISYLTD